jgi:Eph receptor B2
MFNSVHSRSSLPEQKRLAGVRHANVIRLVGVCFRTTPLLMMMEYMPNGDLKSFLRKADAGELPVLIGQPHLLRIGHDVVQGFHYLQSMGYIHCDLAARNVVLSATYVAKIADFGMPSACPMLISTHMAAVIHSFTSTLSNNSA